MKTITIEIPEDLAHQAGASDEDWRLEGFSTESVSLFAGM